MEVELSFIKKLEIKYYGTVASVLYREVSFIIGNILYCG